ncbi:MAG: cytochrome-c peroxidase [Candidatus Berkiella sp.]
MAILGLSGHVFAQQSSAIMPIELPEQTDPAKVALGKKLFQDTLFSKNNTSSCASCHQLKNAGVDKLPRYIGINKASGPVNTPTVFNSSLNFQQFWDGRADTIADAINDHVKDKTIFDNNWPEIAKRISSNSSYKSDFNSIYSGNIDGTTISNALTVYIENLVTPNSSFDRYLKGEKSALSNDALKGYRLFRKYGCIACHQGPNIGGNLYQPLGIYKNYFADKGVIEKADYGLFNVTGKEEDKFVFKVPSLRNISLTGPYLHDGSVKTLPEVIQIMGVYQVGQPIRTDDANLIAQFLQSLTASPDKELLTATEANQ